MKEGTNVSYCATDLGVNDIKKCVDRRTRQSTGVGNGESTGAFTSHVSAADCQGIPLRNHSMYIQPCIRPRKLD